MNYNNPLGACPACEGFGNVIDVDMDRVVPDPEKSLRDGAIAPWNTPAYAHELEELLALAKRLRAAGRRAVSRACSPSSWRLVREGVPERKFGGLKGFFDWLERRKYKMHIRVFLSRWRSYYPCPECGGARLEASGARRADRRAEHRRDLAAEDPRRARVVRGAGTRATGSSRSGGCWSSRS